MKAAIRRRDLALAFAGMSLAPRATRAAVGGTASRQADVAGRALLIAFDGAVRQRVATGVADASTGRPLTANSAFRLASISKTFTSAILLMLVQEGRCRVDDPLKRYFGAIGDAAGRITLAQLLTHTHGLPDHEPLIPAGSDLLLSAQNVLELVGDRAPDFVPGSAFRYSNTGYCLLALVVEQITGLRFAVALDRMIFKPLGMARTCLARPVRDQIADRAMGHVRINGRLQLRDAEATSFTEGDGGVYSTLDDLYRWHRALLTDFPLTARMRTLAFTPTVVSRGSGPDNNYGFGWVIDRNGSLLEIRHTGHTCGTSSALLRYPDRDGCVICLVNEDEIDTLALARQAFADSGLPEGRA